jgi:deazaflavin-dependent oxidoreductase (nitroreductase family)
LPSIAARIAWPRWRSVSAFFSPIHIAVYRLTGGAMLGRWGGLRILLLSVTGRRTGRRRLKPVAYLDDDDSFVVVASYGGSDTHPEWWLNLRTHPETEIRIGRSHIRVRAHEVEGEERRRLWSLLIRAYPPFQAYQARTQRVLPVIRLERIAS